MDIVTAFLMNALHKNIYVEQHEGFIDDEQNRDMMYKLGKSLYGLK